MSLLPFQRKDVLKAFAMGVLLILSEGFSTLSAAQLKPIQCTIQSLTVTPSHPPVMSSPSEATNWSGYVSELNFASPECGSVSYVYGSWTVPTITASPNDSYLSIWAGIDGFGNDTVEQIGTAHNWVQGARVDYAWFEMYPLGAYELMGFPLEIGDVIGSQVSYIGNYTFELTLTNYTQGVYTVVPTSYTVSESATRLSAEWIAEAPYAGGVLALADFGTVAFTNCLAIVDRVVGPINDIYWMNDYVTMVDPTGTIDKSVPSALSAYGRNFSVTWMHE